VAGCSRASGGETECTAAGSSGFQRPIPSRGTAAHLFAAQAFATRDGAPKAQEGYEGEGGEETRRDGLEARVRHGLARERIEGERPAQEVVDGLRSREESLSGLRGHAPR